jgi:hypothetical protein
MILNLKRYGKVIGSIAFLLTSAFGVVTTTTDQLQLNYAATITDNDLKRHLEIIASDAYEGRETAQKGQKMAAEYIGNYFRSIGIPELPNGGYEQKVPLIEFLPGKGDVFVDAVQFQFGRDFYYVNGIDEQELKLNELVFAGYGITTKTWNDYHNLNVSGKAVIALAGEPVDKDSISRISQKRELSDWSTQRRRKINLARDKGARALFIVMPDLEAFHKKNQHAIEISTTILKGDSAEPRMPTLYITQNMANALLGGKQEINNLKTKINKKGKSKSLSIIKKVSISIHRDQREVNTENVLGYIEGTDLKNELIVLTAHYDHLGKEGNVVFNGADDDGTGTVAILELAEAFMYAKKEGHGPRRSILFMTVSGEEKGLLGSKWYSEHPVFPLENTVCDLNIDMIGRLDPEHEKDTTAYIYVIGSDKLSTELKVISETANKTYANIRLDYRYDAPNEPNNFYYRSDHYNFARKGVPVIFYFNGTHTDYHQETDEVSKINFQLMQRRSRLVFHTAWELANRNQRLRIDKKSE